MKSKIINNLSFCGEVMDVDAFTGGYNVQIAFATGYRAGNNIESKELYKNQKNIINIILP